MTPMFLGKIRKTVDSFGMIAPGDMVVAGVSGGSDSMALLFALWDLREFYPGMEVIVSHVNHGLRGAESDEDAEFVREAARRLGFPFECVRVDTEGFRKKRGLSLEDAARELRYGFFNDVLMKRSARRIATAHTLNDQAETVIMRFMRGSGSQGLAGIRPSVGNIIRPLINVTKREAVEYLRSKEESWREDSTNSSDEFLRNRVRNELIPLLESYNPAVEQVLSRAAAVSAAEADFISAETEKRFGKIARAVAGGVLGDTEKLLREPPAIRFSVMRKSVLAVKGNLNSVSAKHLFSIDEVLRSGEPSAEVNLPGGVVFHAGHGVFFFTREEKFREFPPTEIKTHGTRKVSRDLEVTVELTDDASLWGAADVGYFAPGKVGFPVTLRSFSEGDRFVPLGMKGAKKLKDFFIDEKIPRFLRKKVPVFETRDGIIWVGGLRMDDRFKADETKAPWLRISIRGSSRKLLGLAKSSPAS